MTRSIFLIGSLALVAGTALIPVLVTAFVMKAEQWEAERNPALLKGRGKDQRPVDNNPNRRA